jgi:hypothetical protein
MSPRKKKPRRGRPPGPPENVRRRLIVLRLTPEEHEKLSAAARARGEGVAVWMRQLCLRAVGTASKSNPKCSCGDTFVAVTGAHHTTCPVVRISDETREQK